MLNCRNAEGVHGQRKVGNPCLRGNRAHWQKGFAKTVLTVVIYGIFVGLVKIHLNFINFINLYRFWSSCSEYR